MNPVILLFLFLTTVLTTEDEIALLLPHKYGKWRYSKRYNPYRDIRRNIFVHSYDPELIDADYHAYYAVIYSTCDGILRNTLYCVECHPQRNSRRYPYCRGESLAWRYSHFSLLTQNCGGKWLKISSNLKYECRNSRSSVTRLIFA